MWGSNLNLVPSPHLDNIKCKHTGITFSHRQACACPSRHKLQTLNATTLIFFINGAYLQPLLCDINRRHDGIVEGGGHGSWGPRDERAVAHLLCVCVCVCVYVCTCMCANFFVYATEHTCSFVWTQNVPVMHVFVSMSMSLYVSLRQRITALSGPSWARNCNCLVRVSQVWLDLLHSKTWAYAL